MRKSILWLIVARAGSKSIPDKNIKLFYSWIDVAPPTDEAHYRIMQVGVDRTYTYSDVVRVKTGVAPTVGGNASNK